MGEAGGGPIFIPLSGSSSSGSLTGSSSGSSPLNPDPDNVNLTTNSANPSASQLSDSSSSGSSTNSINQISNFNVTHSPLLPDIISIPLTGDEFIGNTGVALIGSNPAFEVNFDQNNPAASVISADIEDSDRNIFSNIPFMIVNVSDKLILTLQIPDDASPGISRLYLNKSDGSKLAGVIRLVDFISLSKIVNDKERTISKPHINKITYTRKGKALILNISGNNFIGNKIIAVRNGEKSLFQNGNGEPFTSLTVFPNNSNVLMKNISVTSDGKNITARLILSENLEKLFKGVISVSTPRGIITTSFVIKK